jgi:hypothetical protein
VLTDAAAGGENFGLFARYLTVRRWRRKRLRERLKKCEPRRDGPEIALMEEFGLRFGYFCTG